MLSTAKNFCTSSTRSWFAYQGGQCLTSSMLSTRSLFKKFNGLILLRRSVGGYCTIATTEAKAIERPEKILKLQMDS